MPLILGMAYENLEAPYEHRSCTYYDGRRHKTQRKLPQNASRTTDTHTLSSGTNGSRKSLLSILKFLNVPLTSTSVFVQQISQCGKIVIARHDTLRLWVHSSLHDLHSPTAVHSNLCTAPPPGSPSPYSHPDQRRRTPRGAHTSDDCILLLAIEYISSQSLTYTRSEQVNEAELRHTHKHAYVHASNKIYTSTHTHTHMRHTALSRHLQYILSTKRRETWWPNKNAEQIFMI